RDASGRSEQFVISHGTAAHPPGVKPMPTPRRFRALISAVVLVACGGTDPIRGEAEPDSTPIAPAPEGVAPPETPSASPAETPSGDLTRPDELVGTGDDGAPLDDDGAPLDDEQAPQEGDDVP